MSTDSPNPFADNEKEPNPFADDLADDAVPTDPFAPPQSDQNGGYNPNLAGQYEQLPGRGGSLMAMAVIGLMIAITGLIPFMCCMPVNVLGLAFSIPVWIMAKSDLKAINIGAIDEDARSSTKNAYIFGIVGTVVGLIVPPALLASMLFLDIGTQAMKSFFDSIGL